MLIVLCYTVAPKLTYRRPQQPRLRPPLLPRLPEYLSDFAREEDRAQAPWNANLRVRGTMRVIP